MAPASTDVEAPTADQPLVAQPDNSITFYSYRPDTRIIWRSKEDEWDGNGRYKGRSEGRTITFTAGALHVPVDPDAEMILEGGKSRAGEVLEFLEGHPDFKQAEGFWRVEPTAPAPADAELETLQNLALSLDVEGLRAFIAAEQEGYKRQQLLKIAEGTLERAEAMLEDKKAEGA